jgi:transposase
MAAFSTDLRQRVLDAALRGDATERAVAERFGVSRSFVQKIKRLWRTTGSVAPSTAPRGPRPTLSDDDRAALAAWVEATPDATAEELARRLDAERGVSVGRMAVNRALLALGLTLKKRRSAPTSGTATMSGPSGRPS